MSINPANLNLTTVGELGTAAITEQSYFPHTVLGGLLKKAKISSLYTYLKIDERAGVAGSQAGTTAATSYVLSQKGVAGGLATLASDGRVVADQLRPDTSKTFLGSYDALNNYPNIKTAAKVVGGYYIVSVPGFQSFDNGTGGTSSYDLAVGDQLIWDGIKYSFVPAIPDDAPESSLTAFRQV